jgi:hypothetical protein
MQFINKVNMRGKKQKVILTFLQSTINIHSNL